MNFTETEVQSLSQQVDQRLWDLRTPPLASGSVKFRDPLPRQIPEAERQAIESYAEEPLESFLPKFFRAAHQDLCREGGILNQQWRRYGDLDNKDLIAVFAPLLVDLGIRRERVPMILVPLCVIVLHLTVATICQEYGHEPFSSVTHPLANLIGKFEGESWNLILEEIQRERAEDRQHLLKLYPPEND